MIKNILNTKLVSPMLIGKQYQKSYYLLNTQFNSQFNSKRFFSSSSSSSSSSSTTTTATITTPISTPISTPVIDLNSYGSKKKSPLYHRGSTQYTNTTRENLISLEKDFIPITRYTPVTISDKFARATVWFLRKFSNIFFREKYIHYAIVLETVAACPGMVASSLLHLRALRTMESNNWIKVLMDEAENERMHLMTFVELAKPTLWERTMVAVAQGIYWNLFLVFYVLSPKTAHRFTGYLEEEAIITYNGFLRDIDSGLVKNVPAPQLAIEYWGLPEDSTLRDVILVIRQDENDHRSVNHEISDKISKNDNSPVEFH